MKHLLTYILLVVFVYSCKQEGGSKTEAKGGLEKLSYTLYSDRSELFVEFKPLVVGQTSTFATHLTILGENFLPVTEGKVTVSFILGDKGLRNSANSPTSPGIFRLAIQPEQEGVGRLVFDIITKEFSDQFIIENIRVNKDLETALSNQPVKENASDISFLKEQAWKVPFANAPVLKQTIYDVIKTTGEIQSAPGDEITIASRSNGIVKYEGNNNVIGSAVKAGQPMFQITGGEIAFENIEASRQSAAAELSSAKTEFERASALIKDKLITQSEFQQAKLRFEQAQINLNNLNRNYISGKKLSSPINGFIKNILVSEGQYVSAGQPLATITKNQQMILRADVSLKDAEKINSISQANFTLLQNKQSYNTKELNGKIVSAGKTTGSNQPFIPVHFNIDTRPGMLPGSFAEVYLQTSPIEGALVIPQSAIIEEQGNMYVFVQTGGESFQKREIKIGVNDGKNLQVLSGITEGERIVVKGGYQIKLAQASGALPAHGHEH